jgi:glycosyltransferase involved in cell wall biosynthesis
MHVCFLCNEYPPFRHGGVGSFTRTLGRALVSRGHQVSVLGVYPVDRQTEEMDQGVRVIRVPATTIPRMGFVLNGIRIRKNLHRIHNISAINIIDGPELSLAYVSRSFPATKLIRMHGGHHFFAVTLGRKPRPWRSWQEVRSFAHADRICAVSRYVGETTCRLLGLDDRHIEILPNPVDTSSFAPRPAISEQDGLIVFVGTVCEKKGIRQLIQAMPMIVDAVPNARLWVLGRDSVDAASGASYVEGLRESLPRGMEQHVVFRGPIDNSLLPEALARAQICIYPSHMEALPVAWLEGLAMGKAVVASATGPGREVVEDGITGLLCDPHDPASIADRVVTLFREPGLRSRLGAAARERAIRHFSVDALVLRNEAYYDRCMRESKGA